MRSNPNSLSELRGLRYATAVRFGTENGALHYAKVRSLPAVPLVPDRDVDRVALAESSSTRGSPPATGGAISDRPCHSVDCAIEQILR